MGDLFGFHYFFFFAYTEVYIIGAQRKPVLSSYAGYCVMICDVKTGILEMRYSTAIDKLDCYYSTVNLCVL